MKLLLVTALATLATCAPDKLAPLLKARDVSSTIADKYIVVFKDDAEVESVLGGLTARVATNIVQTYKSTIKGFSGEFDAATLEVIRALPEVAYVEPDSKVSIDGVQSPSPWNLGMVSAAQQVFGADQQTFYYRDPAGDVATVYVIDTGIYAEHPEFGGRAYAANNFVSYEANVDYNGHGTHVAGIAGSINYGVFKGAYLAGVKVLDAGGSGDWSTVIAGIDWVAGYGAGLRSVINMSLGGGYNQAVNDAVQRAVNNGIIVVVAAGNEGQDACNVSPASTPDAITVGWVDINYNRNYYSNWGGCVDIFAPGQDITSTWSDGGYVTISGTSMASPHVAGVAAYLLQAYPGTDAATIKAYINQFALPNVVGDPVSSPNLFINNGYFRGGPQKA